MENFEFLLGMVIWHDILLKINLVSKKLQSKDMCIDAALKNLEGLISFFENYRENGFASAMIEAKNIACDMGIEPEFPKKRQSHRKKQFNENINDETVQSVEE